jgi:pyruvate kinase
VPTRTGTTARMISRFNPAVWMVALSGDEAVCDGLAFSYGVHPLRLAQDPENWREFARSWLREHEVPGSVAMLVAGPSAPNPDANHRIEFLRIGDKQAP